MRNTYIRPLAHVAFLLALLLLGARPALAQSILRDAETEELLQDMAAPIVAAAGLDPKNVDIVLINDNSVNAFVAGGQAVYVHSGLIAEADTALQVQGVIAHELGHITGGHVIGFSDGAKKATNISILSLILGAAAAAAGGGEAAMGVIAAGQQAAMGSFLAFTRGQESAADLAGAQYLSGAGLSGKGSLEFFKKLQQLEHRAGYYAKEEDTFYRTHPLSRDRIETLQAVYEKDPAWQKPEDPVLEERFRRVKAKLYGYQAKPEDTLIAFPETDNSIPAHYARAYSRNKEALIGKSVAEADALLLAEPDNPYFLELKGQVLLESGQPDEALQPLRRAVTLSNNQPLIATLFGHALLATEDANHHEEAERVLRAAVARDRFNPTAWYMLGRIYADRGDTPRARLASAEQLMMTGRPDAALQNAAAAEASLPAETPDWLRAQDIKLEARAEIEQRKKRK
ncbi:M48 family metalloprotease [Croceicoccus naphthovorans]|uniref:Peptidase M48 n=1 Tax=Croceicoccus naphthovorans TaxID=1348774 RepID=A0A0G3XIW6_9SPHN|nr:M48 family metalloprotease [Croceicoccus naphthovorans]AKM11127.1 peptidase M48 [Croceicoccus naphthovorans]MBB3989422.1 putative Zn-dependent protease [Croceicoccus naphthovorans]